MVQLASFGSIGGYGSPAASKRSWLYARASWDSPTTGSAHSFPASSVQASSAGGRKMSLGASLSRAMSDEYSMIAAWTSTQKPKPLS
jgi:hypothetical protein